MAALAAANLRPDTSDPDPIVKNAFLDSRWVGCWLCSLELCSNDLFDML